MEQTRLDTPVLQSCVVEGGHLSAYLAHIHGNRTTKSIAELPILKTVHPSQRHRLIYLCHLELECEDKQQHPEELTITYLADDDVPKSNWSVYVWRLKLVYCARYTFSDIKFKEWTLTISVCIIMRIHFWEGCDKPFFEWKLWGCILHPK